MKDIHEVLRRKQAQYATLAKQIEALQAAADKLREVAALLSDSEEEGIPVVLDEAGEESRAMSAKASSAPPSAQPAAKATGRGTAPRWP
ncbi:MAG TPA: hypothetical protein VJX16_00840 [Terriglobales bacterium]|nr:hypothetical protein [Terriglobales bacterium]